MVLCSVVTVQYIVSMSNKKSALDYRERSGSRLTLERGQLLLFSFLVNVKIFLQSHSISTGPDLIRQCLSEQILLTGQSLLAGITDDRAAISTGHVRL